jgi:hypothetical protein
MVGHIDINADELRKFMDSSANVVPKQKNNKRKKK